MPPPKLPSHETDHVLLYLESPGAAAGATREFSPLYRRLALRSRDGKLVGFATFRVFADHFLITRFLVRQQQVGLGLKMLQALKAEAARSRKETIWLETPSADSAAGFYKNCGFEMKAFYQVNPEDPRSPVKEIWLLKQLHSLAA